MEERATTHTAAPTTGLPAMVWNACVCIHSAHAVDEDSYTGSSDECSGSESEEVLPSESLEVKYDCVGDIVADV